MCGVAFYVYLLRCTDGSYYVGQTDDLSKRMAEHEAGEGGDWTARRLPVELAWSESFGARDEAREAERQIKGWGRAKKEALVRGDWDAIALLAKKPRRGRAASSSVPDIESPQGHATSLPDPQPRRS